MKKIYIGVAILASIVSFSATADEVDGYPQQGLESIYATYKCHNKMDYILDVEFNNKKNELLVTYKDKTNVFPNVLSADGAKYSDGKNTYWFIGEKLTINDKVKCHAVDKLISDSYVEK